MTAKQERTVIDPSQLLLDVIENPNVERIHRLGAFTTQPSQAQSLVTNHDALKKLVPLLKHESSYHKDLVALCFQLSKESPDQDVWLWNWFHDHPVGVHLHKEVWLSWIHVLMDRLPSLSTLQGVEQVVLLWLKTLYETNTLDTHWHLLKLILKAIQYPPLCAYVSTQIKWLYPLWQYDVYHPILLVLLNTLNSHASVKDTTRQWILSELKQDHVVQGLYLMRGIAVSHPDWLTDLIQEMESLHLIEKYVKRVSVQSDIHIWKWVHALIGFKLVRHHLVDFLRVALQQVKLFAKDFQYDATLHFPLFVVLKWCVFDASVRQTVDMNTLIQWNFNLLKETVDVSVESLMLLSGSPSLRRYFDKDEFWSFLRQTSQQTQLDMGLAYHLVILIHHLSSYKKVLSEEEKQVKELRKFAKQDEEEEEEEDSLVDNRIQKMIKQGAVGILNLVWKMYQLGSHTFASQQGSQSLPYTMALIFQNFSQSVPSHGELVQQGALKTVLNIIETYWPGPPLKKLAGEADAILVTSGQCLARLAIRLNPELAFREEMLGTLVISMTYLLLPGTFGLYQFEALMALTNLMSLQQERLVQLFDTLGGIPLLQDMLMDQNDMIRRAAVELVCNLVGWDKQWKQSKWVSLFSLYCDDESQDMRRAASGCLATLISEPDVLEVVATDEKGLVRIRKLLDEKGSLKYDIWHRAFEIWKWLLGTHKPNMLKHFPDLAQHMEQMVRREAHTLQQQRPDVLSSMMETLLIFKR